MRTETTKGKRAASEIVAAIAMVLLILYVVDAAVAMSAGQEGTGFLPMSEVERGMILGGLSIILFLVAFGINWKANSMVTATLLIAGGFITGMAVIIALMMGEGAIVEVSTSFIGIIIIGFVIMGLGIWQAVKIRRALKHHLAA